MGEASVVLAGEFGFGNYGAEADLVVLASWLRKGHSATPIALSFAPGETAALYGITAHHLVSPVGLLAWLRSEHAVVAGGANLDSSAFGRTNGLAWYLAGLLLLRKLFGKSSEVRGVGIYRVRWPQSRLLGFALRGSRATARDAPSERLLRSIGCIVSGRERCPARHIIPLPPLDIRQILDREGVPVVDPILAFSIRRTNRPRTDASVAEALAELADQSIAAGYHILFVPTARHRYKRTEDDCVFMSEIRARMTHPATLLVGRYPPQALAGIFATAAGVVTSRHHVLALCEAVGTPAIALDVAEKVGAYLAERGDAQSTIPISDTDALAEALRSWVSRLPPRHGVSHAT